MELPKNTIEIAEIKALLPHRYPMLLVDRVLDYQPMKTLHAIKNVSINEPVFNGHFPDLPIFPGVMILEALAQATGLLGFKSTDGRDKNEMYLFASIDKAKFKKSVVPGDTMHLHVEFLKERRGMWKFYGEARVEGKVVCCAELMCARRVV
ncbi:MAG: 3-hydroxyacyl-[acyl-carrier-protein] dehydratase [Colwellia sp.]|uniref:3-hydroxyacyl-ACP dehydratase FabZ n=1 Tax=unclassified Colwellia TaxID=196834 RepID=UPI000878776A|nr:MULTISPECIES: 3-hydroxyacyl-ACP dehydratase FabZ [unclassified Colwellia]MBA6363649.1 3-hydroxyacyl-ACP dehydratase FabZ [Colwellia sp. BRX8-8]AOW75960.1 3-hydroxyacyl-[acyl-carrier-protein] dehydratase FabZ [Colwellia sp. PAMC 20917]MBA6252773.1 3-hydroxyacyl-ACP dehydratase FabZ [Colwellia sp. MB3u-55]MBA6338461.1 3-hydroxyacyl-ACP dehydratase FabZ [Colwellia sp. BRX8-7]MBA6347144.1 3-hydroxyacyl-ACP dehydratase FabZ [Colwellia sp. BRX8-9]